MKHLKQEFDRLTFKEVVMYSLAVAGFIVGTVMVFLSLHMEPRGEIHPSVLTYYGLTLTFCSAILGISTHYSSELTKFKAEVMKSMDSIGTSHTHSQDKPTVVT